MPFIKRNWTAAQADEWTREDWIAIVISPLAYVCIMVGTALAVLFMLWGFVLLLVGIILTIVMHWVIDPKLKAISHEYEQNQAHYIEELEKKTRWEKRDG